MPSTQKTFQYGQHKVTLETGVLARQATAAVLANMGDTTVLVTVVCAKEAKEDKDFFPLTVNYQERTYAAGKIPGGYFKREGKPTERETLISRLIDRPVRPLFPDNFYNEVQIIATVLSLDPEIDPDIPAMLAASAALMISGVPFHGPVGAARVGYKEGVFLFNPTYTELELSSLDLIVAGTESAVLMVESEAKELPEDVMLGAVMFGHGEMQTSIRAIKEFVGEAGKARWDWKPSETHHALEKEVSTRFESTVASAYQIREQSARKVKLEALRSEAITTWAKAEPPLYTESQVKNAFEMLERKIVRSRILSGESRIDGRDTKTVRPVTVKTGVLPRTHGSALFTRGETQALVITTLGTGRDAQIIDALSGEEKQHFMLHYNFPPYCVGEIGMVGAPKRREIGHGKLAKRAVEAVVPGQEDFPYVIRVVSEITESNGSSSMATVCGTSLSLMDASVPIKAQVAGVAMGLIKEGKQFAVLTDILGDEDHLGDMDFKVAGTAKGITALQMDIKIDGITQEIMDQALAQAKEGRLHLLNIMNAELSRPREQMSNYAPRIMTMHINPEKIREVIGKGGSVIRALTEETGAVIDITDDGTVNIAAVDNACAEEAKRRIQEITAEVEVGHVYEGTVAKIVDFGAFVNVLPGRSGLLHISQIANERIEKVTDKLSEGQVVKVKVLEIDKQGRIRLSMKDTAS